VGQAEADRREGDALSADPDVVVVEDLRHRIVLADAEHDVVDLNLLGVDELVAGPGRGDRYAAFEGENAVGGQVAGGVLEAADLVVLAEQVPDGVVDEVDEPVGASGGGAGHVADGDLHGVASWLLAQPVDHSLGLLDAVHADAGFPERQGDPPGAHGELQRVPPAGEPGEERDGLLLISPGAGVVALGDLVSEALLGVKAQHGRLLPAGCGEYRLLEMLRLSPAAPDRESDVSAAPRPTYCWHPGGRGPRCG
jgi:hypothetical protein